MFCTGCFPTQLWQAGLHDPRIGLQQSIYVGLLRLFKLELWRLPYQNYYINHTGSATAHLNGTLAPSLRVLPGAW